MILIFLEMEVKNFQRDSQKRKFPFQFQGPLTKVFTCERRFNSFGKFHWNWGHLVNLDSTSRTSTVSDCRMHLKAGKSVPGEFFLT